MPELPEVEHFRQILLPLAGTSKTTFSSAKCSKKCSYVVLECPPPLPTKRFPSQEVIDLVNQGCYVIKDVLRKGKVLCILLQKQNDISSAEKEEKKKRVGKSSALPANETSGDNNDETKIAITGKESMLYLSLHMGMTGRISSPEHVPGLESLSKDDAYPPPHTHLVIKSNGEEASFSDPRRFGSVLVGVGGEEDGIPTTFQDITSDALAASEAYCSATMAKSKGPGGDADMQQPTIVEQLMNRKKGIKGLLLDQRAVVSGVGNWVCDEVLYRSCIHPDQSYLNAAEAKTIAEEMYHVLSTAVKCLNDGDDFPEEWLFHRRWRNGGGGGNAKDFNGKTITFIQSGGRSTAIVPTLQKNKGRKSLTQTKKSTTDAVSKKRSGKGNPAPKPNNARPKKKVKSNESTLKNTKASNRMEEASLKPKTQPARRSKRLAS